MATKNGPYQNHARIEWVYSVPAVKQSSSSLQASVTAYLRMDGSSSQNKNSTVTRSGHWGSNSKNQQISLGPGQRVQLENGGGSAVTLTDSSQTRSFSVSVTHFFGTTSNTLSVTYPARYAVKPTSLAANRVSDAQIALTWTRESTYTSVVVQRRTDGGSWSQIAKPSGNVASYTDTTTVAGHKYEYRVAGVGGSGQSAFTSAVTVYTTPGAPTGVSAERAGDDIIVSAVSVPEYATAFDVMDGATVVATSVELPWTDVSPNPAVPHTYKVRGTIGALAGAWSDPSNTVQLLTAPNAPTGLSPNGGVAASDADVKLTWVHNPVDSSPQTAYELRYRVGAAAWTTLSGTTDSFRDVSLSEDTYDWQVRTKGLHPDWSPWSAVATVTVITRPGVAVTQPTDEWDLTALVAEWSYSQAQSRPQSAWRVKLFDADMAQIEQRSGSGAATSATLTTRIVNGLDYTVQVEAATGAVWSAPIQQSFTAVFVPPAEPTIEAVWDEATGSVTIHTDAGSGEVEDPDTVSMDLDRSVDGETWEPIFTGFDPEQTVVDFESLSYGDTQYRATAYASTGASAETVVTVEARSGAVWLAGGPGFAICGRLPFNPKVSLSVARARAGRVYAGRTLPVAYAGEQVSRVFRVSGMTADEALSGEVTAAVGLLDQVSTAVEPTHMLRDPDGRRVYGLLGQVESSRELAVAGETRPWNGVWSYSFELTDTGGAV